MASRKEQKEKLRREREEREAAARAAERRRRMIGYGAAGGVVALVVVVLIVVLLAGGGGGDGDGGGGSLLPTDIEAPDQKITDLNQAVKAAGCELESFAATSREHSADPAEKLEFTSNPPTSGKHFESPADDGEYDESPTVGELVHSLEHGRVIIWFRRNLPRQNRGVLKSLFDEDPYQMIITPDPTRMKYAVAATAWNADPQPNGTGRLLGCPRFTAEVPDAIRAFKEEHRSNGPEPVP